MLPYHHRVSSLFVFLTFQVSCLLAMNPITDPLPPTKTTAPTIDVCFCPLHPGNFTEQACEQQWISKGKVLAVKQVTRKGEIENIYTVNHLEIFRGGSTLSSRLLSPTLCGVKLEINGIYLLSAGRLYIQDNSYKTKDKFYNFTINAIYHSKEEKKLHKIHVLHKSSGSFVGKTKKLTSGECFSLNGGQTLWSKISANERKELEQLKCPTGTTIPPP